MSFIVTFIAAVFVFSAVIAIHEFGHFMVAKLCGVQVNEFSIGMGPVLCRRVRKGTQYSIRALPVGGFVALEGEESPESKQAEERSNPSAADGGSSPDRGALGIAETSPEEEKPAGIPLNEAPVWQRALIMLAGAGMNFVLGFVVMAILITAQSLLHNEHIIGGGLMFLVLRIDGRNGTVSQTVQKIQALGGELVDLTVTQKKNDIIRVEMRIKPGKNVDQLTIIGELETLPCVREVNE